MKLPSYKYPFQFPYTDGRYTRSCGSLPSPEHITAYLTRIPISLSVCISKVRFKFVRVDCNYWWTSRDGLIFLLDFWSHSMLTHGTVLCGTKIQALHQLPRNLSLCRTSSCVHFALLPSECRPTWRSNMSRVGALTVSQDIVLTRFL
jgi:hypothetical protein